ncbi:helix-turn-helix domain-containing protein [Streptomyces sp. TG1A-60]|uniref:helix-turn-helix domain-containing protein n=1 Tax=Streptomyces sp. TG1A-60 TaxID=3129111 RepID=UPI0030CCC5A7
MTARAGDRAPPAWCESGFNLVRAAAALHVHRNTVVHRMQKIEQITGRPRVTTARA